MKCTCGEELEELPLRNNEDTDDQIVKCENCGIEIIIKETSGNS